VFGSHPLHDHLAALASHPDGALGDVALQLTAAAMLLEESVEGGE
jgi:hypothetical protein